MAESPYRGTYGLTDEVREPTAEERALIAERHARDQATDRKNELGGPRSVIAMGAIATVVFVVAAVFGNLGAMFGAGIVTLLCLGVGVHGYRAALARLAQRRGRWGAPASEWRTHEVRLRARSVLYAASEDEDYITWVVFEIPSADWAAIDDLWIPPENRDDLTRELVHLTWLEPAGECIRVVGKGAALPKRGAVRLGVPGYTGDDFAQAIADGFGWGDPDAYEEGIDPDEGPIRRVPESELAPWMRDAVSGD